ncbi:MAG TPA: methyltransferase [Myxococcota bacterium]|nr:methyltransferase [Myxococcota bacterium]
MKITKAQAKLHNEALGLVEASSSRRLTLDERAFIVEHYHEGATHMNGLAGAFFTPPGLARDFALHVSGRRIVDLCAGIGGLSFACCDDSVTDMICVELNPEYARVGRAVMPDARWIEGSVFDPETIRQVGRVDTAVSNPPFGAIPAAGFEGKYTGGLFEYRLIELASRIARGGAFIIPQMSAPFAYSGRPGFVHAESERSRRFTEQTGLVMEAGIGVDTAIYRNTWKGVSPICEIVVCDFEATLDQVEHVEPPTRHAEAGPLRQGDLFGDLRGAA